MTTRNLLNGDCLEVLKTLSKESVDCVITSPPYNVDLGNNKFNKNSYDLYNDNIEHKQYISWLREVFSEIYSVLVKGGRVCINIGDGKNGAVPTSSDIIKMMIELNYIPITHIIWNKNQTSARTAWGSYMSPSCPSYPTPFEHILIFCKEERKLQHKGETDLTKDEFVEYAYGIWNIAPEKRAKEIGHPAPFPVEIPKRLIKMNTYIGDTVLDPFMGSGTTGCACKEFCRRFIGIELSENYYNIAKERIAQYTGQ